MTRKLSTGRNGGTVPDEPDIVDPFAVVAERWHLSVDSLYRAVKRGELKVTTLGPRRRGLRRSEQRRYLDQRTA
jgi:hypothetical protein